MIGAHTNEWKALELVCGLNQSTVTLLYGRKGTEAGGLVRTYTKDKGALYYYGAQASGEKQQQMFAKQVETQCGVTVAEQTYAQALAAIPSGEESFFLVIEEVHLLLKKEKTFLTCLRNWLEQRDGVVHVLFSSTDVSWGRDEYAEIAKELGRYQGGSVKVEPLKFLDLVRLFPSKSIRECIEMYGITGGIPDYLPCWNPKLSIKENICRHMLSPRGYLYGEAEQFLKSQLRETAVYETILATIAEGKQKLNDIYKETGFSRAKISVYIKNLAAFGVVEKCDSFETGGWDNAQKGVYGISDTFLHFWFTFVYPHQSQLMQMQPQEFYDAYIAPGLDRYLERYFVKVCREYFALLEQAGELPIETKKDGTWIGKQGRIDIILQNDIRENVVAYCCWAEREMTMEHLAELDESMELARVKAKRRYLFSAGTFAEELKEKAKNDETIVLVDMNSL